MCPRCEFCGQALESEEKLLEHLRDIHQSKVKLKKFENPRARMNPDSL